MKLLHSLKRFSLLLITFLMMGHAELAVSTKMADSIDEQRNDVTNVHDYFLGGVDFSFGVNLFNITDHSEWLDVLKKKDLELPDGTWIVGGGWNVGENLNVLPTRQDLDIVIVDHPIALLSSDAKFMWLNTGAMKLLNITAQTASPIGGEIIINAITGEPTGILKGNAIELVTQSCIYKDLQDSYTFQLLLKSKAISLSNE